jgi:hypothetical protein
MTPQDLEEYRNLRATISVRGTQRVWIAVVGLSAWGGLLLLALRLETPAWGRLVPLVTLAGVFEAVFALHVGVERIGRYIQVFLERDGSGWEHRAMALASVGAMKFGGDAMFSSIFLAAVVVNALAGVTGAPGPGELVLLVGAHVAALGRMLDARRRAARQRATDLQAFRQLSETDSSTGG